MTKFFKQNLLQQKDKSMLMTEGWIVYVGDKFEMFLTDSLHWKSHNDSAIEISKVPTL